MSVMKVRTSSLIRVRTASFSASLMQMESSTWLPVFCISLPPDFSLHGSSYCWGQRENNYVLDLSSISKGIYKKKKEEDRKKKTASILSCGIHEHWRKTLGILISTFNFHIFSSLVYYSIFTLLTFSLTTYISNNINANSATMLQFLSEV